MTLREVYGMTEAASFTTINLDGPPGSIGKPMDYFSVSLHDEEGTVVGVDQVGEIALKSLTVPLLTPGYYRNPEATAKAFREARFFTGDLARQDEQGYLYFCGRVKDRIRCKGEMITATDIESVFNDHPGVVESAVLGVNTESGEQELVVFIQCVVDSDKDRTDQRYSVDEIIAWADKQLATFQQPRYVVTVEQFPRTPSLRIAKHRLLKDGQVPKVEWDRDSLPG